MASDHEARARELADHCRYCERPDYRPKCQADFEHQIAEIAAALADAEARGAEDFVTKHHLWEKKCRDRPTQGHRWQEDSLRQAATIKGLAEAAEDRNIVDTKRAELHYQDIDAAYIKGMERARQVAGGMVFAEGEKGCNCAVELRDAITAEIDKMKVGK